VLLLEVSSREISWIDRLLDEEASSERNPALELVVDDPRPAPSPAVAVIAPEPVAAPVPAQLIASISAPILQGQVSA
jgi:hypothetical protein